MKNSNNNNNKKEQCNSLLETEGTFPYYYVFNNRTTIIKLTHIQNELGYGVRVNFNAIDILDEGIFDTSLNDFDFMCDKEASFDKKTITYGGEYRIEFPMNTNETIILKSMMDIYDNNDNNINTKLQQAEEVDFVLEETIKIAKPIQVLFIFILI